MPYRVETVGERHFVDGTDLIVILQVLTDALELVTHRDADFLEHIALPDAGQLQNLRAADGTRREQNLAARLDEALLAADGEVNARSALFVERNALHLGMRDHAEVGAVGCIAQIRDRR